MRGVKWLENPSPRCGQGELIQKNFGMSLRPKLVITDIDGVWTDGAMYYGEDGSNSSDSTYVTVVGGVLLESTRHSVDHIDR